MIFHSAFFIYNQMRYLRTYEELFINYNDDESEQTAHDELFGVKANLAFDFNREFIHDVSSIKDLIEKYNHFYIKEKSWSGGPPPRSFVEYFNKTHSKKGNASLSTLYPTIDLIIESKNYGKLILGFSIIDKSYKLFNWGGLAIPDAFTTGNREEDFNKNVLSEIGKYVREHLNKMTLEDVIDELNLDVTNYFEWEWKQTLNESQYIEKRFQEFRKVISDLKDLSLEFEDNDCQCKIFPDDEIKLNILSLKSSGHLGSINQPFYLEIDINHKIIELNKGMINRFPDWFIENCREIESYMHSEGFNTKPSIRYGLDWENLETISELADNDSLIYKVRLEFLPI